MDCLILNTPRARSFDFGMSGAVRTTGNVDLMSLTLPYTGPLCTIQLLQVVGISVQILRSILCIVCVCMRVNWKSNGIDVGGDGEGEGGEGRMMAKVSLEKPQEVGIT